jgi:hypothetical protein
VRIGKRERNKRIKKAINEALLLFIKHTYKLLSVAWMKDIYEIIERER